MPTKKKSKEGMKDGRKKKDRKEMVLVNVQTFGLQDLMPKHLIISVFAIITHDLHSLIN